MAKRLLASSLLDKFHRLSDPAKERFLMETHDLANKVLVKLEDNVKSKTPENILQRYDNEHYSSDEIDEVYYHVLKKVEEGYSIKAATKKVGFEYKTLYRRISNRRKEILKTAKLTYTKYQGP